MKKLATLWVLSFALLATSCGEKEAEGEEENVEEQNEASIPEVGETHTFYGHNNFEIASPVSIDAMCAEVDSNGLYDGQISGPISAVCQMAGCWITIDKANGESVRVMFKDHFTIPIETTEGTEVVLNGMAQLDTISIDLQKHFLDDAKEAGEEVSEEEYAAITEDKIEVSFVANGILIPNK